jgi:hypothetical protein
MENRCILFARYALEGKYFFNIIIPTYVFDGLKCVLRKNCILVGDQLVLLFFNTSSNVNNSDWPDTICGSAIFISLSVYGLKKCAWSGVTFFNAATMNIRRPCANVTPDSRLSSNNNTLEFRQIPL